MLCKSISSRGKTLSSSICRRRVNNNCVIIWTWASVVWVLAINVGFVHSFSLLRTGITSCTRHHQKQSKSRILCSENRWHSSPCRKIHYHGCETFVLHQTLPGNGDTESVIKDEKTSINDNATSIELDDDSGDDEAMMNNDTQKNLLQDNSTKKEIVQGIGGQDGVVYDVNSIKRNLVQKAVQQQKRDLLELLASPDKRERATNKVMELLQANPVSTTTDSNLLDGRLWTFAFMSNKPASELLNDTATIVKYRKRQRSSSGSVASSTNTKQISKKTGLVLPSQGLGGPFRSSTRLFNLETNLFETGENDEKDVYHLAESDPTVVDRTTYFGGAFSRERRYKVVGLTRTSLDLELAVQRISLFRRPPYVLRPKSDTAEAKERMAIQILYLDSDLCISIAGPDQHSPVYIYTNKDSWVGQQEGGLMQKVSKWMSTSQSPLKLRLRLRRIISRNKLLDSDTLLKPKVPEDESSPLKVRGPIVRLGEVLDEQDTEAWDGDEDPFVKLSAIERQKVLKKMSLEDIYKAGREQMQKSQQERKRKYQTRSTFKKPQEEEEDQ